MLLAVPYFLVANIFKGILEDDGDAWLALLMLWFLVLGTAFLAIAPIGLFLLARAMIKEAFVVWRESRHQNFGG